MKELVSHGNNVPKPLGDIKTAIIAALTDNYSNNEISIDLFEKYVSMVENANSLEDIRNIINELKYDEKELINQNIENISQYEKIVSHGSKKIISSKILMTQVIDIELTHGKIILDYSNISLPDHEIELKFKLVHSKCILILPDNVLIDNRINEIYSKIKEKRKNMNINMSRAIRLSGDLTHSQIVIKNMKMKLK